MKHGEVWLVDFAPVVGEEIDKKRPAIIASHNAIGKLQLKVVIPITGPAANTQSWHIPIKRTATNGLAKDSIADCFQVKSISNKRILKKIGHALRGGNN